MVNLIIANYNLKTNQFGVLRWKEMHQNMKIPKRANLIGLRWRGMKGVALAICAATVLAQNALIGRFVVATGHIPPTPPDAVRVPSRRSEGIAPLPPSQS